MNRDTILNEMTEDRLIIELNYKGKLEYEIATVSKDTVCGFSYPKKIRKQTFFSLLSNNLIEEITSIWPVENTRDIKFYKKSKLKIATICFSRRNNHLTSI